MPDPSLPGGSCSGLPCSSLHDLFRRGEFDFLRLSSLLLLAALASAASSPALFRSPCSAAPWPSVRLPLPWPVARARAAPRLPRRHVLLGLLGLCSFGGLAFGFAAWPFRGFRRLGTALVFAFLARPVRPWRLRRPAPGFLRCLARRCARHATAPRAPRRLFPGRDTLLRVDRQR